MESRSLKIEPTASNCFSLQNSRGMFFVFSKELLAMKAKIKLSNSELLLSLHEVDFIIRFLFLSPEFILIMGCTPSGNRNV